jgi:hypothetical protein
MLHILLLAIGGLAHIFGGAMALPGFAAGEPPVDITPPAGVGH